MDVARHGNDAQGANTQERMVKHEHTSERLQVHSR